jgi:hypothetical protein
MGMGGQNHSPAALLSGKRHGTHIIEGCVGPRVGLDGCRKSRPQRDSIPGPSSQTARTAYFSRLYDRTQTHHTL